jgi:Tfp pilus assembly protein PilF
MASLGVVPLRAQPAALSAHTARVREYRQAFPTYPFGDPNPIPVVGRIYPYFRFDGFTDRAVTREWKVVELENDHLRVLILPEIGGKIWAAIEKKSGRSFIYHNHAVKFRDIAMRGPWTSGGIEANYGIIGHTPNVSTPVDYTVRTNADGSVSCITGALDLLTGTTWRLETRLAPDEASFTTSSTWYNGSSLEEPYYTWMTAGIPTAGDLQYVFPGTSQIGHVGEPGDWPVNRALGRDVSWYERNDFGPYKSYHVFGGEADFFGAYWHDLDFGMARVAPRDEKPGQKIWIWGLSRQGMIWEQLLTDADGQYSELQSGRLFNQSSEGSTFTPFKHRGFAPHQTDRWTERWMPVVGTKGFVVASGAGALNVTQEGDRLIVAISPAVALDDSLIVTARGRRVLARRVRRAPLQPFADTVVAGGLDLSDLEVVLGDHAIDYRGAPEAVELDRPITTPPDFDWTSPYGIHLRGKELIRQREYDRATVLVDSALARDPYYVPALADRAALALRAMQYDAARGYARTALSVDTYDGAANYYYGLANRRLDRAADARDGFEIASQSMEYRAAAWSELAKLWLAEGDAPRAAAYAAKALAVDAAALDALGVRVVVARRAAAAVGTGDTTDPRADTTLATRATLAALEAADPLSHLARFERLLARRAPDAAAQLRAGVRSELPEQQLFQLAAWYQEVGEVAAAARVLEAVGDQPEALYWRAALTGVARADRGGRAPVVEGAGAAAAALIARANTLSPRLVLPFRPEVIGALELATALSSDWKPRYYLALGYWGTGRVAKAATILTSLGVAPDYAPFYALRASLPGRAIAEQLTDLRRAAETDATEWRFGKLLAERELQAGDASASVATARAWVARFPESYILGLTLARSLIAAERYPEADSLLGALHVLPYEGAAEGHALYREAKLMLAVDAMRERKWGAAQRLVAAAREWPERLGAGKPYDANVDERLEDWLSADIVARSGAAHASRETLDRLAEWAAERTPPAPAAFGTEGRVLARWRQLDR